MAIKTAYTKLYFHLYRHYKGHIYYVLTLSAKDSRLDDAEPEDVVYIDPDDNQVYHQPQTRFFERLMYEGRLVDRFTKVMEGEEVCQEEKATKNTGSAECLKKSAQK